ncbi:MAG: hypothetical protein IJ073_02925 [Lachnospiraceae bacterium]|nr:hypothetical protein [Lachnospiraceae bacterium]
MNIRQITEENTAEFEDLLPAEYLNDIFREPAGGIVGTLEDTGEIAAALFFAFFKANGNAETEAELTWFFAEDQECGTELLKEFERIAASSGAQSISDELSDLSTRVEEALKEAGYSIENAESRDLNVTIGELGGLSFAEKEAEDDSVRSLSGLSFRQYRAGIRNHLPGDRYGLLPDLLLLPMNRFDPDISCAVVAGDTVHGFLLVHLTQEGVLMPELLFSAEPDSKKHLLNMLRFSIHAAASRFPADTKVLIRRHNEAVKQLSDRLFPDKRGETVRRGNKRL